MVYMGVEYYIDTLLSPGNSFRTMDLDRAILGKAYVGRIKAFDNFGGTDLVYGIVYKGVKEHVDYSLFKSVCSTHNDKFFYSKAINKDSITFTMRNCLKAVENYPMVGTSGVSMLDFPMTFTEFGKLAYENCVLTSSKGYQLLCEGEVNADREQGEVPVPPPSMIVTKVRSSIVRGKQVSDMIKDAENKARELKNMSVSPCVSHGDNFLLGLHKGLHDKEIIPGDKIHTGGEEVIAIDEDGSTNITMDALKERCLLAEAKAESYEIALQETKAQIATLKAQAESATASSEKFMTAAALADSQRREYRSDNASEIVDGLKTEFETLKATSKHLSVIAKAVGKGNAENVELLTEVQRSLEDFPERLSQIGNALNLHTASVAENFLAIGKT